MFYDLIMIARPYQTELKRYISLEITHLFSTMNKCQMLKDKYI